MSTLQISMPPEYGYVLLTATLSTLVNYYHVRLTSRHRRLASIPYPNAYAPASEAAASKDKYLFNCAQRAHANFLEHQPQFLVSLLISGLKFPVFSAVMGVVWCAGRVVYARGYTDPGKTKGEGRMRGSFFYGGQVGLLLGSIWAGVGWTGVGERVLGAVGM
ncbi:MAG: hypothetical protein Q9208_001600 [Pyrenodesmia sp. 3 TL-2023]